MTALAVAGLFGAAPARAQEAGQVSGRIIDRDSRVGVADVAVWIEETSVAATTNDAGVFTLRGVGEGTWTLVVFHLAYGRHRTELVVGPDAPPAIEVRIAQEAIELEPLVVETESERQREARVRGSSMHVVERPQIEAAIGRSRHLGDVLRQTVPGLRLRQNNNLAGQDVCLEFRSGAVISLLESRGACYHPMVYLDGVQVVDPNYLYGMLGLQTLERIEVIPPGEAGARYGSGSLYGVILIETRPPPGMAPFDRPGLPAGLVRERITFDWDQDPAGHDTPRAAIGAFAGNALGLALGLAIAQQCIGIDALDEIDTSCGGAGTIAAGGAAVLLPALGSALGARWGGRTDGSMGRTLPAMLGAGMMLFPGYAFSLSTVGGGSDAANTIGNVFLVLGTPFVVTVADKLFRDLR